MDNNWIMIDNIKCKLNPGLVQIVSDDNLKECFNKSKLNAFIKQLKSEYKNIYNKDLNITEKSLRSEIITHYKMYDLCMRIINNKSINNKYIINAAKWIEKHTNIIDCGEKKYDNNRLVWDLLSKIL
jgi:hypothetical protein